MQQTRVEKTGEEIRTLRCGRGLVAYEEYGDPAGEPVLFCHGWPSSRTMARLTDAAARDLGVRIISPDRPGICASEFCAERKLLDWPELVAELREHLGISSWRVLGISGGAPYAFATAWAMPEQTRAVAVVSGAPPIAELTDHAQLLRLYRWMLALHARNPALLRTLFRLARPFARTRPPIRLRPLLLKLLQPCDADVLRDTRAFEACFESARQAWRGSAEGVITDAEIYAQPWGFDLEEVRVPVRLWHGTKDRTFSFRLSEQISERLPHCRLRLIENAGHYSLPIRNMHEILADLLAAGQNAPPP
jgi:pimeloyl-ACP methyl ester carboxylesterase